MPKPIEIKVFRQVTANCDRQDIASTEKEFCELGKKIGEGVVMLASSIAIRGAASALNKLRGVGSYSVIKGAVFGGQKAFQAAKNGIECVKKKFVNPLIYRLLAPELGLMMTIPNFIAIQTCTHPSNPVASEALKKAIKMAPLGLTPLLGPAPFLLDKVPSLWGDAPLTEQVGDALTDLLGL